MGRWRDLVGSPDRPCLGARCDLPLAARCSRHRAGAQAHLAVLEVNRSHEFTFESNASRPVSGVASYGLFDYWSGERRQLLFSTNVHPTTNLSVDFIYTHNAVDHPAGAFDTTTLSNRVLYAFTTDLFVKSYIQWNDLDQRVSANVLVGWEYRPGSEIYLVYDESRDRFDRPNLAARNRMLLAKCTYKFRF